VRDRPRQIANRIQDQGQIVVRADVCRIDAQGLMKAIDNPVESSVSLSALPRLLKASA
jgi:hypothetical protein